MGDLHAYTQETGTDMRRSDSAGRGWPITNDNAELRIGATVGVIHVNV